MGTFKTKFDGRASRDISSDEAIEANHAAGLVLYYAHLEGEAFGLGTLIAVQATAYDPETNVLTKIKPDIFTAREILEWARRGGKRKAFKNEPTDFYPTLDALADERLPADA